MADGSTVVLAGGISRVGLPDPMRTVDRFSPTSWTFDPKGEISWGGGSVAGRLPDGRVLLAGGGDYAGSNIITEKAMAWDPVTGVAYYAGIGSMSTRRAAAASTTLRDGRILAAGGIGGPPPTGSGGNALASAEAYDPSTNAFVAVGSLAMPRVAAVAAPLPDGRLLVVGGSGSTLSSRTAEIFDPASNTFSSAGIGQLTKPRVNASAAPLGDGRILVVGGDQVVPAPTAPEATAEVFDPDTKSFSPVTGPALSRDSAVAFPLPDGRVMVAGGEAPGGTPFSRMSAEIYPAKPFTYKTHRTKLVVQLPSNGRVRVRGRAIRGRSAERGSAGKLRLKLRLREKALTRLETTGSARVRVTIRLTVPSLTSAPHLCVVSPCSDDTLVYERKAALKLKAKRR